MDIKMKTGTLNVIESNTVLTAYRTDSLIMELNLEEDFTLSLEFVFSGDDKENDEYKLDIDVNERDNKIIFKCINFGNSLGIGTTKPIEIATVDNKKIYIGFWIYVLGKKGSRKIDYTIYKEA